MTTTSDTRSALEAITRAALLLRATMSKAEEIQWESSPAPKPREDTTQRAKGGHGDPTADIVLDERRQNLREEMEQAEGAFAAAAAELAERRRRLESAISVWEGHTDTP